MKNGLPAGFRLLVKIGGATLDRWESRSSNEYQYPKEIFEQSKYLLLTGAETPTRGAELEQTGILAALRGEVPGVIGMNVRLVVSDSEHRNASPARPGSVYMNIVRPDVARTREDFLAAMDEHKLANPAKYAHTLRLTGEDAFTMGTSAHHMGTSAHAMGTSAYHMGTDAHMMGTSAYAMGTSAYAMGTARPRNSDGGKQPSKQRQGITAVVFVDKVLNNIPRSKIVALMSRKSCTPFNTLYRKYRGDEDEPNDPTAFALSLLCGKMGIRDDKWKKEIQPELLRRFA